MEPSPGSGSAHASAAVTMAKPIISFIAVAAMSPVITGVASTSRPPSVARCGQPCRRPNTWAARRNTMAQPTFTSGERTSDPVTRIATACTTSDPNG